MSIEQGPMEFPRRIPFVEHLGLELWSLGDGTAELRLTLQDHQMNSMLVAHGGVVMTLLDVVMAHAALSTAPAAPTAGGGIEAAPDVAADVAADVAPAANPEDGAVYGAAKAQGVVTVEMKTTFMRASHGQLRAVATVLHRTATMAFCEGSVFDTSGALCAHATGTFKYVRGVAGHATRQAVAAVALDAREEAQEAIQQAAQQTSADAPAATASPTHSHPASDIPQPISGQDTTS